MYINVVLSSAKYLTVYVFTEYENEAVKTVSASILCVTSPHPRNTAPSGTGGSGILDRSTYPPAGTCCTESTVPSGIRNSTVQVPSASTGSMNGAISTRDIASRRME